MSIEDQAACVQTREDLVAFIETLSTDFMSNQESWANVDLASFLEAMSAWSQVMEQCYKHRGETINAIPPWRVFADILMAARIYE